MLQQRVSISGTGSSHSTTLQCAVLYNKTLYWTDMGKGLGTCTCRHTQIRNCVSVN